MEPTKCIPQPLPQLQFLCSQRGEEETKNDNDDKVLVCFHIGYSTPECMQWMSWRRKKLNEWKINFSLVWKEGKRGNKWSSFLNGGEAWEEMNNRVQQGWNMTDKNSFINEWEYDSLDRWLKTRKLDKTLSPFIKEWGAVRSFFFPCNYWWGIKWTML